MPFFTGQAKSSMDQKGRISIPAKFRKIFSADSQETIVLCAGIEKCAYGWTTKGWQQLLVNLKKLQIPEGKKNIAMRHLLTTGEELNFDKQGRITLPGHLIKYANLDKDVLIAGNGDRLEVWDATIYQEQLEASHKELEDIWDTITLGSETFA